MAESGTITFGNHNSARIINSQTGDPAAASEGIRVALYWSPSGTNFFSQIGGFANVGVPLPGLFAGGTRTTGPETQGGSAGQFMVRAWDGDYSKYERAAAVPGVLIGQSPIIEAVTGNPAGDPPMPPGSLMTGGLQVFAVSPNTSVHPFPLIDCADDKTVACDSEWSFDPPLAFGGCGTNLTISVLDTVTNGVCRDVITRIWMVADDCGNSSVCSQTVTIALADPILLTCAGDKSVLCNDNWAFDPPAISIACDTNYTLGILQTVTNGACPEIISRTWVATNLCTGDSATCTQNVSVFCSECVDITLTKRCPQYPVPPGGIHTYAGSVTNTGVLTLTNVVVYNDHPAPNTLVFGPATLQPGQGAEFTDSYTVGVEGPYEDTLTVLASAEAGLMVTNSLTTSCPVATTIVPGDRDGNGIVDQSELNAVLSNYWANTEWVSMSNPVSRGEGLFEFALTNASGWNFTVLFSTNLVDWLPLPGPAYPLYQFHDPEATNEPMRYYRLTWP